MPWSYCSAVRKHVERTDFFSQGNERQSQTASGSWPRSKHCRGEAEMEGCLALNQEPWLNSMHCNNQRHWDLLKYHHQELHFREKSFNVTHLFQCVTIRRHLSITVCNFILKALLFLLKNWFGIQHFIGQWWRMMVFCSSEFSCHFVSPVFFEKFCARIPSERTLGSSHLRSSSAPNRGSFSLHFKMAEWRVSSGALIVWYMFRHINDHICWIKARRVNGKT